MIRLLLLSLLALYSFGATVDCTKVFEQRKAELQLILDKIDDEKNALEMMKNAGKTIQTGREKKLALKEAEISRKVNEVVQREQSAKQILAKNEKILEDIRKIGADKVNETVLKMKPGPAASMLSEMDVNKSAEILFTLPVKKVGEILTKIEPAKAARITERLKVGPPFLTKNP